MRKRIRKKKYVGEFVEYGFEVSGHFKETMGEERLDKFFDDVVSYMASIELQIGGGFGLDGFCFFVMGRSRKGFRTKPVVRAHREVVRAMLITNADVADVEVGPLVDAWK